MIFSKINDASVILLSRGVYKQTDLYTRHTDGEMRVYAKHGAGFILLYTKGATSVPAIIWIEHSINVNRVKFSTLGRMHLK